MLFGLFALQAGFALVALGHLTRWRRRPSAVRPGESPAPPSTATILIPTFNEAKRIGPLLDALAHQRNGVDQIIVVDSRSTDDTRELVMAASKRDPRIRLLIDEPLPPGWIGKAWALECARRHVSSRWILGLDADTEPRHGMVAAVLREAERRGLDAASFSPRFAGQTPLERWLQPSLLVTLIHRFSPTPDERALANGQCFLVKRDVLDRFGGFRPVKASFAEDVSLATHLSRGGARVAFLDGSQLYDVRSYASAGEMWREWGRSLDLKDATAAERQVFDVVSLLMVQALPLPVLVAAAFGQRIPVFFLAVNVALFVTRLMLGYALRHNYRERGPAFWLSPFSEPLAAVRVLVSSLRRPTAWRGREYACHRVDASRSFTLRAAGNASVRPGHFAQATNRDPEG
jgi:dolichol-phosphate mannosyltransferase